MLLVAMQKKTCLLRDVVARWIQAREHFLTHMGAQSGVLIIKSTWFSKKLTLAKRPQSLRTSRRKQVTLPRYTENTLIYYNSSAVCKGGTVITLMPADGAAPACSSRMQDSAKQRNTLKEHAIAPLISPPPTHSDKKPTLSPPRF